MDTSHCAAPGSCAHNPACKEADQVTWVNVETQISVYTTHPKKDFQSEVAEFIQPPLLERQLSMCWPSAGLQRGRKTDG